MKQLHPIMNWVLTAALAVLVLLAGLPAVKAQSAEISPGVKGDLSGDIPCDTSRTVQTTGSALIHVQPDRATIRLGVQSNGVTTDEVQIANATLMRKVIDALRGQGVEAKDIATDLFVIEPIYDNYNSLYIKGYRINNVAEVTLRDVSKTSQVIAAALKAGANQVIAVDFVTSELRKYRDQARELAVKAAKEKAQALATAVGSEAGCPIQISENSWSYYNGWWYGGSQNGWTQNVVQNAAPLQGGMSSGEDGAISLGQISVKAEVTATFGLAGGN